MKAPEIGGSLSYFAYDLLTGNPLGQVPLRGVQFGQQLNRAGQLTATIDLTDPRVLLTDPIGSTAPNRTLIVVDCDGVPVWGGITLTRVWNVQTSASSLTRSLQITCSEMWSYFGQRVQATDYSAPPASGIVSPMPYWTATPFDATLIAAQVIADAIGYADSATIESGDLLGGLLLNVNGAPPSGSSPPSPAEEWVAINFPITSAQTVDSIISQLYALGLGTGFDYGIDLAYSAGRGSALIGTINLSYPRRGRTVQQDLLLVDLSAARGYQFPEDGTQTANQVWEIGGTSAISVSANTNAFDQGYPLWERVMSRSNAQSANMMSLLAQFGVSDLALYSYALTTPVVTLGLFDARLPLGSFTVGDDIELIIPAKANDGTVFDPRFPAGLNEEWRIIQWQANVPDQGDPTLALTLNPPPSYTPPNAPSI